MTKRTWTDEEIALLAQHKVPQGRSLNAARIKAWELHIPFRPNDPNAEPTVPPRNPIQVPTWTEDDLAMLQEKVLPPNRTLSAAYSKANRMHVPFNRIRKQKTPQKEKVALLKEQIVQELKTEHSIRSTARKFGLAFTAVRDIAQELKS